MTNMRRNRLLRLALTPLLVLSISGISHAQIQLQRKTAGSPPSNYNSANFSTCQPAQPTDFRIKRYVPGILQGYFRFDWTLFKDGQEYKFDRQYYDLRGNNALNYQNHTYVKDFLNLSTEPGVYAGKLEVRKRGGYPTNYNYNQLVINQVSPVLSISNVTPTHSFTIKNISGVFVSPPANGAPIEVSLSGGVIMDASTTQCETGYLIIIQESNISWVRTNQNELDNKWFTGQAPANINLQQLTTTYSQSDGTGYFSLLGGNITSGPLAGQPRFYRIGLQAAGAPWNPQMTLIRVNW